MLIQHTVHGTVDVVAFGGRLNMETAPEARSALRNILEAKDTPPLLVVDFGGLEFVDSSGLSVLVSIYKLINIKGGKMVIANLTASVQSLFELTRLNMAFQIFMTTHAAVDYLKGSA